MRAKLIERTRAALRAFWGGGDWVSSDLPGNRGSSASRVYWIPGTRINWDGATGDLWACPAVQACLNWEMRNAPQAPPVVRELQKNGPPEIVPDHPLTSLLLHPNPRYDWTVLLAGMVLSLDLNPDGIAFVGIEYTRGGQVGELWWLPHHMMRPPEKDSEVWTYWPGGQRIEIPPENLARIQFGINPYDTRLGLGPTLSASRRAYTLQQSANYGANVLRNFGTAGMIVSGKDGSVQFDPEVLAKQIKDKTTGDNVGGVVAIEAPVDIDYPGATPEQMALETLEDRPEADIAALFGIPPQVAGLHVGRLSKTYANVKEARESAWEEKLMPTLGLIGAQLGYKLLPLFMDGATPEARAEAAAGFVLDFDYSKVRPLQPDLDARNARVRDDYKAGVIDRYTALTETDRPATDADKGVYFTPAGGGASAMPEVPLPKPSGNGAKPAKDWAERIAQELDLIHVGSA